MKRIIDDTGEFTHEGHAVYVAVTGLLTPLLVKFIHERGFAAWEVEWIAQRAVVGCAFTVGNMRTVAKETLRRKVLAAVDAQKRAADLRPRLLRILKKQPLRCSQLLVAAEITDRMAGESAVWRLYEEGKITIGADSTLRLVTKSRSKRAR